MTDTRREAGFSLAEMIIGITIFVISAIVLGQHVTTNFRATQQQEDRVFAYSKCQALLSEIHSAVDRGDIEAAVDLDVLDDGTANNPVLTISEDSVGNPMLPDHPLSGNFERGGDWVWSRRVTVRPFAGLNNRTVRYVTVRLFKLDSAGINRETASLSAVINSVASSFPTTQVFDVYLLAVESIPGWWVHMETIVPFVESAITDLENRNPGLSVRTHWITKAGYGRNPVYRPHFNQAVDSHDPVGQVYYYPGTMPAGNASTQYYVPDLFNARIEVDGDEVNGYDAGLNPYPYAIADFYNHSMRYPRAERFHAARVAEIEAREDAIATAIASATAVPDELTDMSTEPTLQLFLEGMCTDPDTYRNALVINLHGELLPLPPLRNYSDPAKRPADLPNVRVVTHPEELRTGRPGTADADDVRLRVYAYRTDPDNGAGMEQLAAPWGIAIHIEDVNLTDASQPNGLHPDVLLEKLDGGVSAYPNYDTDFTAADPLLTRMTYYAWFLAPPGETPYTLLLLLNTPLVTPSDGSDRGLRNNERSRLYNLEYVPSCTGSTADFSHNLGDTGDGPKNTARWRITIPQTLWADRQFYDPDRTPAFYDPSGDAEPDRMLTIRTRISDITAANWWTYGGKWPAGSSTVVEAPENVSETYAWWTDSREDVPFTERSQFLGDPRHNPYLDTLNGDPDFGDGYNWWFDDIQNDLEDSAADYAGLVNTYNRWNGAIRADVPRYMELYRYGLTTTRSIYTTLTGYSNYYVGIGNEIGYDSANGYPSSIPTSLQPWGSVGTTGFYNNITGRRCLIRQGHTGSDYWWGMYWLGELCPDWAYNSDWIATDALGNIQGNLPSGSSTDTSTFFRQDENSAYWGSDNLAYGTRMYTSQQRTNTRGCVSFFNDGTSLSHFNHVPSSGDGNLTTKGLEIANNYGFPMPTTVSVTRPFTLNGSSHIPEESTTPPYSWSKYSLRLVHEYIDHVSTNIGSGLVEFENPGGTDAAYVVVNGIAQTTTIGSDLIAKYCLLSMYQSFFEAGDTSLTYRIKQPPRVELTYPTDVTEITDPATIGIQFSTSWVRWDGQGYTDTTPVAFAELESELEYSVMYSADNGTSWRHVLTDALATPGERPDASELIADVATGDETVNWVTPSGTFPEGSYLIRVDCFRQNQALHFSQHMVKIFIER